MPDSETTEQQPTLSPGLIVAACACAALVGIAVLVLALENPGQPGRSIIQVGAVVTALVGVALVVCGVMLVISKRFGDRYDAAEQAATAYRSDVDAALTAIGSRQEQILETLCLVNDRTRRLGRQHKDIETALKEGQEAVEKCEAQVQECRREVAGVTADFDAAAETFAKTGTFRLTRSEAPESRLRGLHRVGRRFRRGVAPRVPTLR